MTRIEVYCDKCSSIIVEDRLCLDVRCGEFRQRKPTIDLCCSCERLFQRWLNEKPAEVK